MAHKKTARGDGVLSPEDLAKAIEEYKARRAARLATKADNEDVPTEETAATEVATDNEEAAATAEEETVTATDSEDETAAEPTAEEKVQLVKDRRDRRDEAGDPETVEEAQGVIAQQDEDMGILFDIIDSLLAQADFAKADEETAEAATEETAAAEEAEATDSEENAEGEETVIGASVAEDSEEVAEETAAETASAEGKLNADSVDAIVRTRIQLGMVGRKLNLDGLEMMRIMDAKKAIIHAVRPNLRLDGKSVSYINAAYDMAVSDVTARSEKDTGYQKRQMFNGDGKRNDAKDENSAKAARERMIARRNNNQ